MLGLEKGDFCIKLITVKKNTWACLSRVEAVTADNVYLEGSGIRYGRESGYELDPVMPGCSSRIVEIDGGQREVPSWAKRLSAKV